jgi:hypothetical protein
MKYTSFIVLAILSMSLLSACAGGSGADQGAAPANTPQQQSSHNATQSAARMISPVTQ